MSQCSELERQILDIQERIYKLREPTIYPEEARRNARERELLESRLERLRERLARARGGC